MPTIRDRAFAKAFALDAHLAQQQPRTSDLMDDLSGFGGRKADESFTASLRRQVNAAEDAAYADPSNIDDARTAPRGWLHGKAEQDGDDVAAEWLDEMERIEALHAAPMRVAA